MDKQNEQQSNFKKLVVDFLTAAMFWFGYGFDVIPVLPGTKKPAEKWDPWFNNRAPQKVYDYWTKHPDQEVGFIVGDGIIVFDADNPESSAALAEIETNFGLSPKMVVKTTKGEHHYFRRAPDTIAKSDSHDSEKYPDRIDIKTGRALIILPISTGKTLHILTTENKAELSEATQEFIDAICHHNGRSVPSGLQELTTPKEKTAETSLYKVEELLNTVDPDCGYDDWLRVGMAVFHETNGSEEGMALYDRWSRKGEKYKNISEIEAKWRSFSVDMINPVTIGTLIKMAADADADVAIIMGDGFEGDESKLAHANGTVKRLMERVEDDFGAPLEPDSLEALAVIKKNDPAKFVRIRSDLKKINQKVSLGQLDTEIKSVKNDVAETHHGYASDMIAKLTIGEWPPVGHEGSLFVVNPADNLWVKHPIESVKRLVAETHDGKPNCQRSTDYSGIANHVIMIATDDTFFTDVPIGLATPDGFYQIKDNEIAVEQLSPSHRQRVKIDVTPNKEETPLFDAFLHETFQSNIPDEEEQQLTLLQEIFGAIMLGLLAIFHKVVHFYDPFGRAGKGTTAQFIEHLVPRQFIKAVSPFNWDREYYLASLIGCRFNSVGELPDTKPIPAAPFKSVTGGDLQTGRHPNQRTVTFKNEAGHLFTSNFLINTQDHSEAFFTRWLIVEFPNSRLRTKLPIDTGLAERIIKKELPGIAYWALKGGMRLLANGKFSESIVHDRMMAKWRHRTNSLAEFIHECCDLVGSDEHILRAEFYRQYKNWCNENGRKPFAKGRVVEQIASNIGLGISHTKLDGYEIFRGIKMKSGPSDAKFPDLEY